MVLELSRKRSESHDESRNTVSWPPWPSPGSPHLPERRREPRYPTSDPATVDVPSEKITALAAVVVDVSKSGLRLHLKQSIGRGMQVKITLSPDVAIFGEVRYCRRAATGFHAGILVRDSVFPALHTGRHLHSDADRHLQPEADQHLQPDPGRHLKEDELSFYLVGKGLTLAETIRLTAHLVNCKACQTRVREADAILNPVRKRRV